MNEENKIVCPKHETGGGPCYCDKEKDADSTKPIYCSFCGEPNKDVKMMIAADEVTICNLCVDICNDIIAAHKAN